MKMKEEEQRLKELYKGRGGIRKLQTSSQDRGIGKYSSLPCTITAKITTRLQNKLSPRIVRKSRCMEVQQLRN